MGGYLGGWLIRRGGSHQRCVCGGGGGLIERGGIHQRLVCVCGGGHQKGGGVNAEGRDSSKVWLGAGVIKGGGGG